MKEVTILLKLYRVSHLPFGNSRQQWMRLVLYQAADLSLAMTIQTCISRFLACIESLVPLRLRYLAHTLLNLILFLAYGSFLPEISLTILFFFSLVTSNLPYLLQTLNPNFYSCLLFSNEVIK